MWPRKFFTKNINRFLRCQIFSNAVRAWSRHVQACSPYGAAGAMATHNIYINIWLHIINSRPALMLSHVATYEFVHFLHIITHLRNEYYARIIINTHHAKWPRILPRKSFRKSHANPAPRIVPKTDPDFPRKFGRRFHRCQHSFGASNFRSKFVPFSGSCCNAKNPGWFSNHVWCQHVAWCFNIGSTNRRGRSKNKKSWVLRETISSIKNRTGARHVECQHAQNVETIEPKN